MVKKFLISCNEASTICDKSQYNEATYFEIIKLKWHLLKCKFCGVYSHQNNNMTNLFKMKSLECKKEVHYLTTTEKDILKEKLDNYKV